MIVYFTVTHSTSATTAQVTPTIILTLSQISWCGAPPRGVTMVGEGSGAGSKSPPGPEPDPLPAVPVLHLGGQSVGAHPVQPHGLQVSELMLSVFPQPPLSQTQYLTASVSAL